MSDRHLPVLRVLGGLLLLGLSTAAWATASTAGVAIVAVGLVTAGTAVATAARLPLPPAARRPWLAAAASLVVTACFQGPVVNATGWWWAVETCALLALLVPTVRRMNGRAGAIACTMVLGTAVAVLPLRIGPHLTPPAAAAEIGVLCLFWFLLAAGAAALGGYVRGQDSRRRRALADQRREQLLEVARDLHDFASHDVMGVVVLVQAARLLAREDPERAVELLPRMEEAGMQALAVMDRTVRTLNAQEDRDREGDAAGSGDAAEPSGRPPRAQRAAPTRDRQRDLGELPALADRFTRTGTVPALLDVPAGVLEGLPVQVSATGYRIVMESLTNVRRHAPAAVTVRIATRRVPYGGGTALHLTVTDAAEAGVRAAERTSPLPERSRGGLGLAGLTDRAEALGGTLTAGPHGTAGWQVAATLPLSDSAAPTSGRHERTAAARHTAPEGTVV
ncbi:sensor histidine kinase [Streptomyces sp. JV184]|uniref:sensor histidine kinase n=1 Tax=Streptomyces sp. JV184 TaxID=858637 RepID=UPI002E77AEED|nr:histidine kinase [Streptomyces sp. JV184]MEE1744446.1 histidine kinase [Streptomyces sp. JV184]